MKRVLFGFLCGLAATVCMGALHSWIKPTVQPIETSLAQILYKKVDKYRDEVNLDLVLSLVKEYANHKIPLKEEQDLYAPMIAFEEKKIELDLLAVREKIETYLKELKENPDIRVIVPERVFVEVLQQGKGEEITSEDVVSVLYKEYTPEGKLLKDTLGHPFAIPLSQTIKGFQLGMNGAKVGEKRKIYLHPDYGFGKMGRRDSNQLLIYEVTVVEKVKP